MQNISIFSLAKLKLMTGMRPGRVLVGELGFIVIKTMQIFHFIGQVRVNSEKIQRKINH